MTLPLPKIAGYQKAKLSSDDYWLLAESGAFAGFAKVELIEGELYVLNAMWTPHGRATATLTFEVTLALREAGLSLEVHNGSSVDIEDGSLPEPDISLAEPGGERSIPRGKLKLAIEVSDTTLKFDLGEKLRLYARGGVPEYWVVDVEGRVIRQHWRPDGEAYAEERVIPFGTAITAATLPALTVATAAL